MTATNAGEDVAPPHDPGLGQPGDPEASDDPVGAVGGRWFAGLSATTVELGELLEAQQHLTVRQAQQLGVGVTDMRALRLLGVHGPMGVSDLARHLDLRPASATAVVDRLEVAGVLQRARDSADRRRVTVLARPEALQASTAVWEPVVRAIDELAQALSDEDARVVTSYLASVRALMSRSAAPSATRSATAPAATTAVITPGGGGLP